MPSTIEHLQYLATVREKSPIWAIWEELWWENLRNGDASVEKQGRHKALIRLACELGGWQVGNWRKGVVRELKAKRPKGVRPWRREIEETVEIVERTPYVPDAWRVRREGRRDGWGYGVAVIELLEVEVTHCLSAEKESSYLNLWMDADASDYLDFRVWRMNRNGFVSPLMADFDKPRRTALSKDLSRWTRGFSFDASAAA